MSKGAHRYHGTCWVAMFKTSFFSTAIRVVTLASKAIFMLFMARYLSPEEMGIFGLISVTISISLYFLGMDFYVFTTREMLSKEESEYPRLIRDQLSFHGVAYLFALPLPLAVFAGGFLPWKYVGWFYCLLVLEHLAQEANRLFITLSRPVVANMVLFLRSGAWIYPVIIAVLVSDGAQTLTIVWVGWITGAAACLVLSAYALRSLDWDNAIKQAIDWGWVRIGVRTSLVFLVATIALRIMEFGDRFFIEHYHGKAMVGVYTFYIQITSVVQTFVSTGIILILYPKIISAYQQGRFDEYRILMRKMGVGSICGAVILAGLASISIFPVLSLVKRPIYSDYLSTYWILLVSTVVAIATTLPNYGLYVRKKDKLILSGILLSMTVALVGNYLLIPKYGIKGAALSNLCAALTLFTIYSLFLKFSELPDLEKDKVATCNLT